MSRRLFVVFVLGFSSGLPMALVSSTLQAWFADSGMSILATGALSLISLPYAYRIFWAPILDHYSLFSLGKRRSWILAMQCLLLVGFNLMAWFTPEQSPKLMALFALVLAFFSATQDIAIDAHRAEYLPNTEHALGASLAVLAYRIALLLSGGFALVVAQKLGWVFTYRFMGSLIIIGMFAVFFSQEPGVMIRRSQKFSGERIQSEAGYRMGAYTPVDENSSTVSQAIGCLKKSPKKGNIVGSFIIPIKELLSRQGVISLLCFIFCYKLGEAFTTTTSGIVMPFLIQGLGFSLETIGYINKILGVGSILLGGLCAGFILMRYSLYWSLLFFGLLQALTNVLFVVLAMTGKNIVVLATAVFSDNFAAGMGSTALVALFMRLVDKKYTGTQFSLFVALSTLPRITSGPVAAIIQMNVGWSGLYQFSVVFAFLFIPFLMKIKDQINERSA